LNAISETSFAIEGLKGNIVIVVIVITALIFPVVVPMVLRFPIAVPMFSIAVLIVSGLM